MTEINEEVPDTIEELDTANKIEEGQYQHTFLEVWELTLDGHILATEAPLQLEVAAGILGAYPWLTHSDIPGYRSQRRDLLKEARETFLEIIGSKKYKDKLYKELNEDWTRHKDLYMQIIAAWNQLTINWGKIWTANAEAGDLSGTAHAAIGDVSGVLLSTDYGLAESLKTLKGFSFTDEDREKLSKMTGLVEDDE